MKVMVKRYGRVKQEPGEKRLQPKTKFIKGKGGVKQKPGKKRLQPHTTFKKGRNRPETIIPRRGATTTSRAPPQVKGFIEKVQFIRTDRIKPASPAIRPRQERFISRRGTYTSGSPVAGFRPPIITRKPMALEVVPVRKRTGLEGQQQRLETQRGILRTKRIRGETTISNEAKLAQLTAFNVVINNLIAFKDLPKTAAYVYKNPKIIKQLPRLALEEGKKFLRLVRVSPTEAVVTLGTELVLLKGTAKVTSEVSKLSRTNIARLTRGYKGKLKAGDVIKLKVGGKTVELEVVNKIPTQSVRKQAKFVGKVTPVAISSQADQLLKFLKRSKKLKKPIPGEAAFTKKTRDLLKKFDEGKLSNPQIAQLDIMVKKEGAKGLLERSFFADPTGKIRPSRLGVIDSKKASLLDLLSGDVSFKRAKPQVLVFKDVAVEKLPKNLRNVGAKLKAGRELTRAEADNLLRFQLTQSGKFKPIGFLSRESEISLAPGEVLKRVKKVGSINVKGTVIPLVQAKVYKPTKTLKTSLAKFSEGKLSTKQIKELQKKIKKETGLAYDLISLKKGGKYLNFRKLTSDSIIALSPKLIGIKGKIRVLSPVSKTSKRAKSKRPISKAASGTSKPTSKKSPVSAPKSPKKPTSPASPASPVSPVSPVSRVPASAAAYQKSVVIPRKAVKAVSKPFKIGRISKRKIKKRKKKEQYGYIIKEKRAGKFVTLKGKPLKLIDAKDRLAKRVDNKLSRTAKLLRVKTNDLGKGVKGSKGYYQKNKNRFRTYKIKRKKKIPIEMTFIEKRKFALNTPGEKRQLALNRRLKKKRKAVKKKPVKKTIKKKVIKRKRTKKK